MRNLLWIENHPPRDRKSVGSQEQCTTESAPARTINAFLKPCFAQCKSLAEFRGPTNHHHLEDQIAQWGCKQLRRLDVKIYWFSFHKITSKKQQHANMPDLPNAETTWNRIHMLHLSMAEVPLSGQILVISVWPNIERTSFNGNFVRKMLNHGPWATKSGPFFQPKPSIAIFWPNMSCQAVPHYLKTRYQ